jgi:hypothetical protein
MTETRAPIIDFTNSEVPRPSRWDRGDGAGAIRSLAEALDRAGLPGELQASRRLLDRAERIGETARQAKRDAGERLEAANRALLADAPIDPAAYAAVLVEVGPWLDTDIEAGRVASAMNGLMEAVHRVRSNAVQTAMAEASGIYRRLQDRCAEVVAEVAAVPALPRQVWAATTSGQAGEAAIRAGLELEWARLVKAGVRWDAIHAAATLLRETGQFTAELNFPGGCPTRIGVMFLAWQDAALRLQEVQRMPGPLRVRAAHDRGWKPGLWLASDHARAAEAQPKRRLLTFGRVG